MRYTPMPFPEYHDRILVYQLMGLKYGKKWGPEIVEWFVERTLVKKSNNDWITRWDLFSTEFGRRIPLSSLYMALGKLAADGFLEMKMDNGSHYFKLRSSTLDMIRSMARIVRKE